MDKLVGNVTATDRQQFGAEFGWEIMKGKECVA
jgi:hypothetical protein